jgi:phage-related protein
MMVRRWRFYATASGRRPAREFLAELGGEDATQVVAAMHVVRSTGLVAARHLRHEIYEVRADGHRASYRLLFAEEGSKGRVLLALHAISKKTQKTPQHEIPLAERRLADWRRRSRHQPMI